MLLQASGPTSVTDTSVTDWTALVATCGAQGRTIGVVITCGPNGATVSAVKA